MDEKKDKISCVVATERAGICNYIALEKIRFED